MRRHPHVAGAGQALRRTHRLRRTRSRDGLITGPAADAALSGAAHPGRPQFIPARSARSTGPSNTRAKPAQTNNQARHRRPQQESRRRPPFPVAGRHPFSGLLSPSPAAPPGGSVRPHSRRQISLVSGPLGRPPGSLLLELPAASRRTRRPRRQREPSRVARRSTRRPSHTPRHPATLSRAALAPRRASLGLHTAPHLLR